MATAAAQLTASADLIVDGPLAGPRSTTLFRFIVPDGGDMTQFKDPGATFSITRNGQRENVSMPAKWQTSLICRRAQALASRRALPRRWTRQM